LPKLILFSKESIRGPVEFLIKYLFKNSVGPQDRLFLMIFGDCLALSSLIFLKTERRLKMSRRSKQGSNKVCGRIMRTITCIESRCHTKFPIIIGTKNNSEVKEIICPVCHTPIKYRVNGGKVKIIRFSATP